LNSRPIVNQTLDPFCPLASLPFFLPSFLPQELGITNSHEQLRFFFFFFFLFSFVLSTLSTANMHTTTQETKKKYNSSPLLQQLCFETNPNNVYGLALPYEARCEDAH
jgi:hypothetical protein